MNILSEEQVRQIVERATQNLALDNKKVLVIIPDSTRTAPVGLLFRALFDAIGERVQTFDILVALGTHPPMSDEAINQRLEITAQERALSYSKVRFFNHAWDDPSQLEHIGTIGRGEIARLSEGRFEMEVPVTINRRVGQYDQVVIIGPVFPHEVVGFSGGSKYLFPGVSGPEVLHFFHWLAALISNPRIIGHKATRVREVVELAAGMVKVPQLALCMVVEPGSNRLNGLFAGTTQEAWSQAADLSAQVHIVRKPRPFKQVLSCAPPMYADLWTGGKCMYKLEPVVEDGGELLIYAPHIKEISVTHGRLIEEVGYHTRDYITSQWPRFEKLPWSILAHSSHVRGIGTMENGIEKPRIRVTLASQIGPEMCEKINLGWRDPASIDVESFANREDEGVLLVRKAGEMLFQLEDPPAWARP